MASALKNLSEYNEASIPSGAGYKVGVVVAEWNKDITYPLFEGCYDTLIKHGVAESDIKSIQVPGTFELPTAARLIAESGEYDAVVCIGCVIKGETKHDEYINNAVANGLVQLTVQYNMPFIFGVLTPNTHDQAVDRSGGKYGNKGVEAAVTALRMLDLYPKK